jgi:hypothetical protein
MAKITIYYGTVKPIVAHGVNQCRLLSFAEKYRGWHFLGKDKATKRAAISLQSKGYIQMEGEKFRFTYPKTE